MNFLLVIAHGNSTDERKAIIRWMVLNIRCRLNGVKVELVHYVEIVWKLRLIQLIFGGSVQNDFVNHQRYGISVS